MADALVARCRAASCRFLSDRRGNIAVTFAIMALPMLSFVGAAVDYARASSARSAMQAALDSTSLMIAKEAATTDDLNARATAVFRALYKNDEVANVTVSASYTPQNGASPGKVEVTGSGELATTFMKVVGFDKLAIGTSSTTTWANLKLRVALALDNTGSMDDANKMVELKKAAKILVRRLKTTVVNSGDVYISVVPFNKDVNVGTSISTDFLDWSWWGSKAHKNWDGCVTDRVETGDYDVRSDPPTNSLTKFSPDDYSDCDTLQPLQPLSADLDSIITNFDKMKPYGGTNQPIGLFWGWWTLRTTPPFEAPAKDVSSEYLTAIVLLTDGVNTKSRAHGNGRDHSPDIDARQRKLCDAIKADNGTVIYTVDVNTDGGSSQQVLKDCASGEAKFFALTKAEQMSDAFEEIAASMQRLRVAR